MKIKLFIVFIFASFYTYTQNSVFDSLLIKQSILYSSLKAHTDTFIQLSGVEILKKEIKFDLTKKEKTYSELKGIITQIDSIKNVIKNEKNGLQNKKSFQEFNLDSLYKKRFDFYKEMLSVKYTISQLKWKIISSDSLNVLRSSRNNLIMFQNLYLDSISVVNKKIKKQIYRKRFSLTQIDTLKGTNKEISSNQNNNDFFKNKHFIKINPSQIISNEVSIYYEIQIKRRLGFEFSAGLMYSNFFTQSVLFFYLQQPLPFDYSGLVFRASPKYYIDKKWFTSINILYKSIYFNDKIVSFYHKGNSRRINQLRTDKLNIIGCSIFIGHTIYAKKLNMELFAGIGLRYKTGEKIIYDETYTDEYRHDNNGTIFPYKEVVSEFTPTFNIGIKFSKGYKIN